MKDEEVSPKGTVSFPAPKGTVSIPARNANAKWEGNGKVF